MPSLGTVRRINSVKLNGAKTIGQARKEISDFVMEETWDNDIQSRICYIYDYYHDDSPNKSKRISYSEHTTKYKIDAKFIITQYGTLSKDQVEYHLMFKPSQKTTFTASDELYYFETNYVNRYGEGYIFPIGMYVDVPDDTGVYNRWIVCGKEIGNQFIKYKILPCNYNLQWIERDGHKKIKRHMWGTLRSQNS